MKICKDSEGYFILTSNNRVVNLIHDNKKIRKLPLIYQFIESNWHSNEADNIFTGEYKIIIDHISKFKCLRHEVREFIDDKYGLDNYKAQNAEYFI